MKQLLLTNRRLRALWLSSLVSQAGDWLSYVAVSLLAMSAGQGTGALELATVFAAHTLPHALLAPFSGSLADRWDRRTVMLTSHLAAAALTLGMLGAAWLESLPALQLLLVARSSVAALGQPAESAALKRLVEPQDLVRANALQALTWSVMFTVGMGLGGLLASLGPALALAADALTFLLAAVLLWPVGRLPPESVERSQPRFEVLEALRLPGLARAVLAKTPLALAGGAAWVSLNLVSMELAFMGTAGLTLGALQVVKGVGTGVGPSVVSGLRDEQGFIWPLSGLLTLVAMGVFVLSREPMVLLASSAIWGLGTGTNWVLSSAALQVSAPDPVLGRLSALDTLLMTLAQAGAALFGAILIEQGVGVLPIVLLALVAWALLWAVPSLQLRPNSAW